jgi:Protein of unknown function (DUF2752)
MAASGSAEAPIMSEPVERSGAVPPRIRKPDGTRYGLWACGGLATVGAAVLFFFNPSESSFYPVCLFHSMTGLQCPGCGSLRAMHQLLHGHLAPAFRLNALLTVSLPLAGWFGLRWLRVRTTTAPAPIIIRPLWLWCGFGVLVVFGVLRNLPLPQLAWLGH